MNKSLLITVSIILFCFSSRVVALNVVFINPSVPGTAFWDRVSAVAIATANDLNINLTIVYGRDNRILHHQAVQEVVSNTSKPDYVIMSAYGGNAEQQYQLLNNAKIPFVTLERTLHETEQRSIGLPQEKYSYWLGEIFHDNVYAGQLLGNELITAMLEKRSNKQLNYKAVGISGNFSGESDDRVTGFKTSTNLHDLSNKEFGDITASKLKIDVLQVVRAGWSRERSRSIIYRLSERYGNIDIVWAASDGMALGVIDAMNSGLSRINPETVVIGGIDWTKEGINKIKQGELTASVGGHFMQASWALIKIYDYKMGLSVFKKSANSKTYDLEVINQDNIDDFMPLANAVNWDKINFKSYSRYQNPKLKQYKFSLKHVINSVKN